MVAAVPPAVRLLRANGAGLTLAAIAHHLTRAAGWLASAFPLTAQSATIRDQLINLPARIAMSGRHITLRRPTDWGWEHPWHTLIVAIR